MSILSRLNSPVMYLICGGIILFVALVCVFFMIRAYRAGVAIGMDKTKMKRTITASATFAALPSVGILLGVIALSGSLGRGGGGGGRSAGTVGIRHDGAGVHHHRAFDGRVHHVGHGVFHLFQ